MSCGEAGDSEAGGAGGGRGSAQAHWPLSAIREKRPAAAEAADTAAAAKGTAPGRPAASIPTSPLSFAATHGTVLDGGREAAAAAVHHHPPPATPLTSLDVHAAAGGPPAAAPAVPRRACRPGGAAARRRRRQRPRLGRHRLTFHRHFRAVERCSGRRRRRWPTAPAGPQHQCRGSRSARGGATAAAAELHR
ncbi:hypothetical protein I4F81_001837 [Pyropia yezoensis]|uniref:Uncharacterized protein n=1 Tax=Pyropia yezoensis TaxID=2788 RepID=A0ACC3BMW1_PYRYE|nr:hypothetical protein I4F81_001837 [Neopyropia yezoensis]